MGGIGKGREATGSPCSRRSHSSGLRGKGREGRGKGWKGRQGEKRGGRGGVRACRTFYRNISPCLLSGFCCMYLNISE